MTKIPILCIIGPTASGKTARAIEEALARNGEIISVDSRQVYTMLDIGTEKIAESDMKGVPHYLIDIRDPKEPYSAGDFVNDAERLINDIHARGKLPILAGGSHYYFNSLLFGLPAAAPDEAFRSELGELTNEELLQKIKAADPRRAEELDPKNRRRLIRALEIIRAHGKVPERPKLRADYDIEWIVLEPSSDELKPRLEARLEESFERGLVDEVRRVRDYVGDARLNELGLEYRIVGEYLRGERGEESMLPAMVSALADYARRQRAWIRKLRAEGALREAASRPDRS